MRTEVLSLSDDLLIRRLVLETGEATPWHSDACRRFSVVVRCDRLDIEYRDEGEIFSVDVEPGLAEWDEPDPRPHRAVNTGRTRYEEVVVFFLDEPGIDPQPEAI